MGSHKNTFDYPKHLDSLWKVGIGTDWLEVIPGQIGKPAQTHSRLYVDRLSKEFLLKFGYGKERDKSPYRPLQIFLWQIKISALSDQ